MASSILCALLLALIKTIMTDVKSITDIANPVANMLADAVAPIHPALAEMTSASVAEKDILIP